jgi:hypothetical protein
MVFRRGIPDWPMGLILTLAFLFTFATRIDDLTAVIEKKIFDLRSLIEEGAGLKAVRELNKAYADLDLPNKGPGE